MIEIKVSCGVDDDPKLVLRNAMSTANVTTRTKVTLPTSPRNRQRFVVLPGGQPYDSEELMSRWRDWHSAGGPIPPPPPPDD